MHSAGRSPLRTPPIGYDRFGRPKYRLAQDKGLAHTTSHDLTLRATREGYTAAVDRALNPRIRNEVRSIAAGQRLDVLEIGGGTGWFFDLLEPDVRSYLNVEPGDIELDRDGLRRLRDPRYGSIQCSGEELPLLNASFDMVLSLASLDHIPDHDAALSEIERCLRPSGWLLLELNNRASWWKRVLTGTRVLRERERMIAREHWIQWSFSECIAEVNRRFEVVRAYTMTFFPYVPLLWRVALPIADALGERVAPEHGANIFVVCRKAASADQGGTNIRPTRPSRGDVLSK